MSVRPSLMIGAMPQFYFCWYLILLVERKLWWSACQTDILLLNIQGALSPNMICDFHRHWDLLPQCLHCLWKWHLMETSLYMYTACTAAPLCGHLGLHVLSAVSAALFPQSWSDTERSCCYFFQILFITFLNFLIITNQNHEMFTSRFVLSEEFVIKMLLKKLTFYLLFTLVPYVYIQTNWVALL
jgi:hypothetical protein